MTAALVAVFALLSLVIVGMFLVAWLDDRLCALRDASDPDKETPPNGWKRDCPECGGRGFPSWPGCPLCGCSSVGPPPGWVDPRTAPTDVIPADPDRRKTQRGSWGRA